MASLCPSVGPIGPVCPKKNAASEGTKQAAWRYFFFLRRGLQSDRAPGEKPYLSLYFKGVLKLGIRDNSGDRVRRKQSCVKTV